MAVDGEDAMRISVCGKDTDVAVAAISAREKGQETVIGVEGAMCITSANVAEISVCGKGQDVDRGGDGAICIADQTVACEQGEWQLAVDSMNAVVM